MPDVAGAFPILTEVPPGYDNVVPPGRDVIPMGTIRERVRKDGSIAYLAQIVMKRKGRPTYREAETFDRRAEAVAYLKNREKELKEPGGIERSQTRGLTVADAIDRYVSESRREIGRTKSQVLETIKKFDIGDLGAADVRSDDLVRFARELSAKVQPQTVMNYMSHLSAVFRIAKAAWGIPLDYEAMKAAMAVTSQLGLTSKSDKRDRRPTMDELDALMTFFGERQERAPNAAPMQKVIAFALFSTRRQEEIVTATWANLDAKHSRLLVEDMKHPGQKIGNDVWVDLPEQALSIINSMPKTSERIFPYSTDAISAAFTRACKVLGIEDLHFHDLRHEGVSRLFEMGWNIPHVAGVSGHRSWSSLQRYTHIRESGDKYEDWKWLEIVTT